MAMSTILAAKTVFRIFLAMLSLVGTDKQTHRLLKRARAWWAGKKIAVVGPTAGGKDSLLARLQNKEIPAVHSNSPMAETVKSFKVKLTLSHHQAIEMSCRGVINVGGETDFRDAPGGWLAVCKDADVVLYVMTIDDLLAKRFLKGRRVREDLDWLLTAMPHLKPGALVHILINKIDERIESHTHYDRLAREVEKQLEALDATVRRVLHPYEAKYTGATLTSMKNKQIYTRAIHDVLRAVYDAVTLDTSDARAA